jgi:hypothetical protein
MIRLVRLPVGLGTVMGEGLGRVRSGRSSWQQEERFVNDRPPRISVIVAAYKPGTGIERVITSLDRQTLPQDEFETIIVDDGSPDDTFQRLQRYAADRPNMTVFRIENSGWPSRPRNLATERARGEWVLYMDHDDSLYPDALRRAAEYAGQTHADVLSPKESKTTDVWWGMSSFERGNVPNALTDGGIELILPMVPHKFYRRQFLLDHGIRFPEGRRMLWEDIYFNVEAWRKAEVVSVLADTPVYLWVSSGGNTSKTYGPRSPEFWNRLDQLFDFIDRTLDGPEFADARQVMLTHQFRGRVLGRFSKMLLGANSEQINAALTRARRLQDAYVPEDWDVTFGKADQARSLLLRAERPDLLRLVHELDGRIGARTQATNVEWRDGRLHIAAEVRWRGRHGHDDRIFDIVGDRVVRHFPERLAAVLPPEVLDVTDDLPGIEFALGIRNRERRVTWQLPGTPVASFERVDGQATLTARVEADVDLAHVAGGRRIGEDIYDFYSVLRFNGISRGGGVRSTIGARSALVDGRAGVAYANLTGNLSLDTAQRLRGPIKDGRPALRRATVGADGLVLPLPGVHVHGTTTIPMDVVLLPAIDSVRNLLENKALPGRKQLAARLVSEVPARLIGDAEGARLEVNAPLKAGAHRLAFRSKRATLVSAIILDVRHDGTAGLRREPVPPRRMPLERTMKKVQGDVKRFTQRAKAALRRFR